MGEEHRPSPMSATEAWIGVAGITGTLLGAVVGPMVTGRQSYGRERRMLLASGRVELYSDLLAALYELRGLARALPDGDRRGLERDPPGLATLDARAAVLASDAVRETVHAATESTSDVWTALWLYEHPQRTEAVTPEQLDLDRTLRAGIAVAVAVFDDRVRAVEAAIRAETQQG